MVLHFFSVQCSLYVLFSESLLWAKQSSFECIHSSENNSNDDFALKQNVVVSKLESTNSQFKSGGEFQ